MKNSKGEIRGVTQPYHRASVLGALVGIGIVVGGIVMGMKYLSVQQKNSQGSQGVEQQTDQQDTSNAISGYALASKVASEWQTDATLSYLKQNGVAWEYIFISDAKQGTGLQVMVSGSQAQTKEIPYQGSGAPMPKKMLSESEAISKVLSMKGFENAEVLSVEAVYGVGTQQWYWGIETTKGRVSIEAER